MKKWYIHILTAIIFVFISCNLSYAVSLSNVNEDNSQLLEQIKQKREHIKHLQQRDEQIGRQIEKKMQILEELLLKLPENGVLPQKQMQEQLDKKLEDFMGQLMRLSDIEMSMWKHLEKANKLISKGKYEQGIKHLDKTIELLEKEHIMIIEFDKLMDEFIELVRSFDLK